MRTGTRPLGTLLLLAGVAAASGPPSAAAVPEVATLVERVRETWDPLEATLTASMTVDRKKGSPTDAELVIRRGGPGTTRIDFLAPAKDRGKVLLRTEGETWLYLPRADRVVEIPARRSPLAGAMLFENLFPEELEAAGAIVEESDEGFVLVTSIPAKRKKGKNRVYFDRTTLLPYRSEIYSASGRLLRTVHIEETRPWSEVEIPWKVRFVDHLRRGVEAIIEIQRVDPLEEDLEDLFSKAGLRPVPPPGDGSGP